MEGLLLLLAHGLHIGEECGGAGPALIRVAVLLARRRGVAGAGLGAVAADQAGGGTTQLLLLARGGEQLCLGLRVW